MPAVPKEYLAGIMCVFGKFFLNFAGSFFRTLGVPGTFGGLGLLIN